MTAIKNLIKESVDAGFYNIDIDASTMVDMSKTDLVEQQEANGRLTAELTNTFAALNPRALPSPSVEKSVRSVILIAPSKIYAHTCCNTAKLSQRMKGISKLASKTGTTHGGVVLKDGSIAKVKLDFDTLESYLNWPGRIRYGRRSPAWRFYTARRYVRTSSRRKGTMEVHPGYRIPEHYFRFRFLPSLYSIR